MKIKVSQIEPCPFRNVKAYPTDRTNVELLKKKIQKTFHWPTLFGRKRNGKYQIPCGHHRLTALKELGITETDFTVREISDADMVIIMADENHRIDMSPERTNQTILDVKNFLDKELAKYKTWEDYCSVQKNGANLGIKNGHAFATLKDKGIGKETIHKFLGDDYAVTTIGVALRILKTDKKIVDRKAAEKMPSLRKAERFAQAVQTYQVPLKQQADLADKIIKKDVNAEGIPAFVRNNIPTETIPTSDPLLKGLKSLVEKIDVRAKALSRTIMILRSRMKELSITEIKGVKVWLAKSSLKQLCKEMERLNRKESK